MWTIHFDLDVSSMTLIFHPWPWCFIYDLDVSYMTLTFHLMTLMFNIWPWDFIYDLDIKWSFKKKLLSAWWQFWKSWTSRNWIDGHWYVEVTTMPISHHSRGSTKYNRHIEPGTSDNKETPYFYLTTAFHGQERPTLCHYARLR